MIYAPVIIPTLNRFDYLKSCLESLNRCHNADKTEVFISVDYPPSEEYKEGHKKICLYLKNTKFRFKKMTVIEQQTNLGVINNGEKKYDNLTFLREMVSEKYDRWILSEDDNIFAPTFLDFIDDGLETFKDDPTIFSVCGYNFYYKIKHKGNNYYRQQTDFNAWGCGFWKNKAERAYSMDVNYLRCMLYNPVKLWKLWRVSNNRITTLCGLSQRKYFKIADNFFTIYMIDHDMNQIMPVKSLVRNVGWDSLGMHCVGFSEQVVKNHVEQEIDMTLNYKGLKGSGWECYKDNQKIIRDEDFQKVTFKRALVSYLNRLFHYYDL